MPDDATFANTPQDPRQPDSPATIGEASDDTNKARRFPATIGRYKIVRLLGEGGMGAVYEAEQENPRRTVALKVIKAAWAGPDLLRRFQLESQALGRLHHPGIAQIYEAGTAETAFGAQPFYAMEIIHGQPLVDYASTKGLNLRQRLELMIQVCEAVEHAHQRGIIHRDLKPGNILVDENGQPKILDFGLALITDSDTQATRQTDIGQLLGTLAYMSPEQVLGDPLALDTRSDVYELGVILYELLAGKMPYTLSRHLHEVVQTIRLTDPRPLSSVNRVYRGDVETIVAKALEKDRDRRYQSASAFAADIRRYLADEPIVGRPPSASYQLQKFARRHKALVAGVAAVVGVLVAGIIASTLEAARARRAERAALVQRDRADSEAAIAKAVNQFVQDDLLSQANPESGGAQTKPDPDVKVRTLLDRAAEKASKSLASQPLVESAIHHTIGDAYYGLGLYPQAESQLRRAYELSAAHRGGDDPETLDLLMRMSAIEIDEDKMPEAISAAKTAFEGQTRRLGPEAPMTVVAMQNLGALYFEDDQYAKAEPLVKKALELQSRDLGYDNQHTLNTSDTLAALYISESRYSEARVLLAKGLESYRRLYGPDHPYTNREMFGLAKVLFGEGNYPEAEKLFDQVLSAYLKTYGERHPNTLAVENRLGQAYVEGGKASQGITLLEKAVQGFSATVGPRATETLTAEVALGSAYESQGDWSRAEQTWQRALEGFSRFGSDQELQAADVSELLGQNLTRQRKYSQAEALLRQALGFREKGDHNDWRLFRAQAFLGEALAGQRRYAEAEPLLLSGYDGMRQHSSRMPAKEKKWIRSSGEAIVELYSQWSRPEQAAQWRAKLQER